MTDEQNGAFGDAYEDFRDMDDPGPMRGFVGAEATGDTIRTDAPRDVPTAATDAENADPAGAVVRDVGKASLDTLTPSGNPREAENAPEDAQRARDHAGEAAPGRWGVPDDLDNQPG